MTKNEMVDQQHQLSDPEIRVLVLLATFNGHAFLSEQLESILNQTHKNLRILASDDGSTDGTLPLLEKYAAQTGRIKIVAGPRAGASQNFISLIQRLRASREGGGYVAFSDQDDIWHLDKIARGLHTLSQIDDSKPGLYCSKLLICDENAENSKLSPPRDKGPAFRNALIQNIASGNTILLNPAAVRVLTDASKNIAEIMAHDWWMYQVISGIGGTVIHDDSPTLVYRQHGSNAIGSNNTAKGRWRRLKQIFSGDLAHWNNHNIAALQRVEKSLTDENRRILEQFSTMRKASFFKRIAGFAKLGLFRQNKLEHFVFWVAVVTKRL